VKRRASLMVRFPLGSAGGALGLCLLILIRALPVQAVVDLGYFEAEGREVDVLISWGTVHEGTTYGFDLLRATVDDPVDATQINGEMIRAKQFPQGDGDDYSYVDDGVEGGVTYYYWLMVRDMEKDKRYGPESATPGGSVTSTPTSTPTSTVVPTATPTSAPTKTPRPTSTSEPTMTPSFTATATPTSTPTATPTATPVSPVASSPTPTPVVEQGVSPTATVESMTQPTLRPAPAATEETPKPTSTTAAVASATSTPPSVAWSGGSEPTSSGGSSWRLHLPTVQPSTILLSVSLTSLLGALLLSVALALVHKLSL
jgi:hypothetical protein